MTVALRGRLRRLSRRQPPQIHHPEQTRRTSNLRLPRALLVSPTPLPPDSAASRAPPQSEKDNRHPGPVEGSAPGSHPPSTRALAPDTSLNSPPSPEPPNPRDSAIPDRLKEFRAPTLRDREQAVERVLNEVRRRPMRLERGLIVILLVQEELARVRRRAVGQVEPATGLEAGRRRQRVEGLDDITHSEADHRRSSVASLMPLLSPGMTATLSLNLLMFLLLGVLIDIVCAGTQPGPLPQVPFHRSMTHKAAGRKEDQVPDSEAPPPVTRNRVKWQES
jgi:hypothetical protein